MSRPLEIFKGQDSHDLGEEIRTKLKNIQSNRLIWIWKRGLGLDMQIKKKVLLYDNSIPKNHVIGKNMIPRPSYQNSAFIFLNFNNQPKV